ncbi:MAG: hypothetical protein WBN41_16760, partial [Lysobacterales bacterium]
MNQVDYHRYAQSSLIGARFMVLLVFILSSIPVIVQAESTPSWLPGLLEKDSITVVVTDSGLGGLSVVADATEKFRQHAAFKQVDLIFFNALFRDHGGY